MKNYILLQLLFISLFSITCSHDKEADLLSTPWKFQPGDDLKWAAVEYNDSAWREIDPTKIWENQGYKDLNGIGWYRKTVHISSELKREAATGDSLQFYLGKIDDCDQVFLNGYLIGENCRNITGRKAPDSSFIQGRNIWNIQRHYLLDINDDRIKWDSDNVIAIRCYDHGGDGGMYDVRYEISATGLKDRVIVDHESSPFVLHDSTVSKTLIFQNISTKKEYQGELVIKVTEGELGSTVYKEKAGVLLTPGARLEKTILFKRKPFVPSLLQVCFVDKKSGSMVNATVEVPYILTPASSPHPRINSASIFGVRPYSPVFFKVAATGEQPLEYRADGLPAGLNINAKTGVITGKLTRKGEYPLNISVINNKGIAHQEFKIVCGELISLTPPMGWNSWNCWGLSVSDARVRESADNMVSSGLIDHGWTYINIDDGWQEKHDREGNILPNSKFPDMAGLCNYIHSLGLKAGIYSSPGPKTCGGYEGSYKFEEKDAMTYARWGMDYLKYDWCSYFSIAPEPTLDQLKKPYKDMRHALRKSNRDIHYSLCQYGMGEVWKWGNEVDGNSWRTTGDITDTWESMSTIGFGQYPCSPYGLPGRWNDPDMLVVGWVGWGPSLHYTHLTPDEQYLHISLWAMLSSPLLIGCDLSRLDEFTMNLLTNDEVIAINQDPLGQQASRIYQSETCEVWARDLADGSKAVGFFNKGRKVLNIPVDLSLLCINGKWMLRDLWRQQDLGLVRDHFEIRTQPHGARLVKLTPSVK